MKPLPAAAAKVSAPNNRAQPLMMRSYRFVFTLCLSIGLLTSCATNPVTGETELSLVSEKEEIQQGTQLYPSMVQIEGGPYRADPALQAYVEQVGNALARVSDRPNLPYEFVVIDNMTPNAWALPGGKIGVNTGLLANLNSEAELAAVIGHEIVHAAARHGAQQMQTSSLSKIGLSLLNVATLGTGWAGALASNAASMGSTLAQKHYSRSDESEADEYGMAYMAAAGYDPQAAVELQKIFLQLETGQSSNWAGGLFASHPPSQDRLEDNQATAKKLNAGGQWKRSEYAEKVARLKRSVPAYEAETKGFAALKKGDAQAALQAANQAIQIEGNEAKFYSLRGMAYLKANNVPKALENFNQAVTKNPYYFLPYLQRGLLYKALNQPEKAKSDLAASIKLLPTETAEKAYAQLTR